MTAIPKKELMARLRAERLAAGLVPVTVWVPSGDVDAIKKIAEKLKAN
jgi:hypothetical protein